MLGNVGLDNQLQILKCIGLEYNKYTLWYEMLAEFDMSESSYLLYKNIKVRSYMKSSQEGL